MLEMEHNAGVGNAVPITFFEGLSRPAIRGTEVSQTVDRAGAEKFVIERRSPSKEERLSTFLRDRHAKWMLGFVKEIEAKYEATRGGLEIIADILQKEFEDPKRLGFAFANIFGEGCVFKRESSAIAREQKEDLGEFLRQLTVEMGLLDPDMAASAAVLVIERTIERNLRTGNPTEAQTARLLFQCLQHA
jgi:hypothetical protein